MTGSGLGGAGGVGADTGAVCAVVLPRTIVELVVVFASTDSGGGTARRRRRMVPVVVVGEAVSEDSATAARRRAAVRATACLAAAASGVLPLLRRKSARSNTLLLAMAINFLFGTFWRCPDPDDKSPVSVWIGESPPYRPETRARATIQKLRPDSSGRGFCVSARII
jgi:hypothetical protein